MATRHTEPCTLQLRGELTIRTIAAAHQRLAATLADAQDVIVDLRDADETDLTLIQLLQAARHSAAQAGKSIALAEPLPETLTRDLSRGGFSQADTSGFWKSKG